MKIRQPYYEKHVLVCLNERGSANSCTLRGSEPIHRALKAFVSENNAYDKVRVTRTGCNDLCEVGPVVGIYPDNVWYTEVGLEDVPKIIEKHLMKYSKPTNVRLKWE